MDSISPSSKQKQGWRPDWAQYHFPAAEIDSTPFEATASSNSNAAVRTCPRCGGGALTLIGEIPPNRLKKALEPPICPAEKKSDVNKRTKPISFVATIALPLVPIFTGLNTMSKHAPGLGPLIGIAFATLPAALSSMLANQAKLDDERLKRAHQPKVDLHQRQTVVWKRCFHCAICNSVTDPVTGKSVPAASSRMLWPKT